MRRLLVALMLFVALGAGACGDDDGGDAASDRTEAGDTAGSGESDGAGDSGDSGDDEEFSGKGSGDFCDLAKRYEKEFEETEDSGPTEETFKDIQDAVKDLEGEAPSEIKADVTTVRRSIDDFIALLDEYDWDFTKVPEDDPRAQALDSPEIDEANERVERYLADVCGIEQDDPTDTTEG